MIVIKNFVHACELYQQEALPKRLLQHQAMILHDINPRPGRHIDDDLGISRSDIEWLLTQEEASEPYDGLLGGYFHICQSEEDLKQIVCIDFEFARAHGNRWPDVTDQVMSWDDCRYLYEKDGSTEWALFLLCWNDAGGPVYYVPHHLWQAASVDAHVKETKRHWNAES